MGAEKLFLIDLLKKSKANNLFKRNLLKEYLQVLVLEFLYSNPKYSKLVFYGGSCLAHCYGLPRLSEDLDFVDLEKEIDLKTLATDLKKYFETRTDLKLTSYLQKFRINLKFPILRELGLSNQSESDYLYLKIEVFNKFGFCKDYKTEMIPLFKFNKTVLVKTFDLSTLMATKIRAILYRKWEKKDKQGTVLANVKGRDYFDLMWYLEKGVKPNPSCAGDVKEKLLSIVDKLNPKSITVDLEALIEDSSFVNNLGKNIKDILKRGISGL